MLAVQAAAKPASVQRQKRRERGDSGTPVSRPAGPG